MSPPSDTLAKLAPSARPASDAGLLRFRTRTQPSALAKDSSSANRGTSAINSKMRLSPA